MVWLALALAGAGVAEADGPPVGEAATEQIWVVSVPFPTTALDRALRQAERLGATIEPVASGIRCLHFAEPPDADWVERVGRRLGAPLERRTNCSVARYPEGDGWWLAVIQPDPELEDRIDASLGPMGMSVLAQPLDGRPASLCVSAMQVRREELAGRLRQGGLQVSGVFPVGSCTSRVHRVPLRP